MPDQTLKQVIMFKQFTKLGAKPKEGALDSDEEFEKIREEKERGRREEAERRGGQCRGTAPPPSISSKPAPPPEPRPPGSTSARGQTRWAL